MTKEEKELKKEGFKLKGIDEELFIQDIEGFNTDGINCDYTHPKEIFELLKDIQVTNDFIKDVINNNGYNSIILDYYKRLEEEEHIDLTNKINSIDDCNSIWTLDKYELQKIKDFKKTNLCKDKFCNNCKKVKQASRLSQFVPQLKKLEEELYYYNHYY